MAIFNSLGSNYDLNFVLQSLFIRENKSDKEELERFLQKKYEGKKTYLVYKGREAISLALDLAKLPKGSYVAINGFTCFAVYEAIKNALLEVEYLDIGKDDLNFGPATLEKRLRQNPKIKSVIIQNTLGYPSQAKEILELCRKNNLILIEDLAHSIGTNYSSDEAGTVGDFTVLSFSQDKVIDSISGGALIVRNSKYIKARKIDISPTPAIPSLYPLFTYIIRTTYSIGLGKIFHYMFKKLSLLSDPMQKLSTGKIHGLANRLAKLALIQFNNLNLQLEHRKKIAKIYKETLPSTIQNLYASNSIINSSNLRFPILVKDRQNLIKHLSDEGIYISDIWYDAPIAPKKYTALTDYKNQCPNSEKVSSEILNLPTHINISEADAVKISQQINKWLNIK